MALLGKRYTCTECNSVALCTSPGDGTVECCAQPMSELQAKSLPSSD